MKMEIKTISLTFVNSYLIKTDKGYILIDTGVPTSRDALEKALETEGVKPGDLKLVIITHGDIDHVGNCAYLRKKYGVKIAMHKNDAKMAETGEMLMERKRTGGSLMMTIMQFLMGGKKRMKKMMDEFEKFSPDIFLEDGQDLKDFGLDAKVVSIPGHTPGSIAILTSDGSLFSGDTVLNRSKPQWANIIYNEESLAATITKLKTLTVNNVYPGHGKPFNAGGKLEF
jgi:glyoxylase-like metal-dependent hydrolase (beta-lactamase superfamily II)